MTRTHILPNGDTWDDIKAKKRAYRDYMLSLYFLCGQKWSGGNDHVVHKYNTPTCTACILMAFSNGSE